MRLIASLTSVCVTTRSLVFVLAAFYTSVLGADEQQQVPNCGPGGGVQRPAARPQALHRVSARWNTFAKHKGGRKGGGN